MRTDLSAVHPARTPGTGRRTARQAAVLLATLLGLAPAATRPATAQAPLGVSATVLARARIASAALPATLEVTALDAARGYVEVPAAARLVVQNTGPLGFALELYPLSAVFAAVAVRGDGGGEALFDASGGTIVRRGLAGAAIPLTLDFRFELAPGVVPGRYAWPVQFAIRPLAALQ